MKLTPRQKELLKSIENKNLRKEIKKEFKKKITFYHTRWKLLDEVEPIVFENGKLETDNLQIIEFLSNHPMCKKNKLTDEFISPEKESKVKVEIVKDEKLKGTGYENSFFKVTIPIGTPIQDSLNAVDEFFKQKPVNFPELTSREKALYKIIEMRREFDESANNVEKQFTLEDMRKIYVNGILDNQNLLVTPETCQITFDMHLRNVEKKQ